MTSSGVRTESLTFAQAATIALVVSVVDFPALPSMLDQKSRATPVNGTVNCTCWRPAMQVVQHSPLAVPHFAAECCSSVKFVVAMPVHIALAVDLQHRHDVLTSSNWKRSSPR